MSTPPDTTRLVSAAASGAVCEGRHAVGTDGAWRLGFPGQRVHLRATARRLSVRLRAAQDSVFLDFIVDGGEPRRVRLAEGEATYPVFHDASATSHSVVLRRRTESWLGEAVVLGFETDGQLLPPEPLPARRFLFVGDSVTCGEVSDVRIPPTEDPEWTQVRARAHTSSAWTSFGGILAERFRAQAHFVSYGGRGLLRDWQGQRGVVNAPEFYERALPDDPAIRWDHRNYVPDAVVIALGTNDFSSGIPDQAEWVRAYVEFVRKIRRDAPCAHVFLSHSPILKDEPGLAPKRAVLGAYLEEIVRVAGDPRVHFAPVSAYPGLPGDGHPTGVEHAQIAEELARAFTAAGLWT